jgi:flagellar biosynthesis/type III secretory pathway M-ring protein FliF/YscJ
MVECKLCSGIRAQIAGAENQRREMKEIDKQIFQKMEDVREEISKRPSTGKLIAIAAVCAAIFGTVATILFWSNQAQITTLQSTAISLQQQINKEYAAIGAKLEGMERKRADKPASAVAAGKK